MALLRRPTVSSDLENIDTGVNSKAKSHVTLRRAVLEEIGNRVTIRPTQVAKKAQNIKVPVQPTKTTNVNKQLKPTASVKPVQVKMLAPKTFHILLFESKKKKQKQKQNPKKPKNQKYEENKGEVSFCDLHNSPLSGIPLPACPWLTLFSLASRQN